MKTFIERNVSKSMGHQAKQYLQDIRLVGRLFVSKATFNAYDSKAKAVFDKQQVDMAYAEGFRIYLHVL